MLRNLALATLGLAALGFAQAPTLTLNPELNKPYKWQLNISTVPGSGGFALGIELKTSTTFTEKTADGIVGKSSLEDLKLSLNGSPMDLPGGGIPPGSEMTMTYKPNGEMVSRTGGDPNSQNPPRFEKMMEFTLPNGPIKIGDSWMKEVKADPAKKLVAARGKMTYVANEVVNGINTLKLDAAYSELEGEKPMGMIGKVWLEAATGLPVKVQADMNDVSLNEMMPATNVTFSMIRLP